MRYTTKTEYGIFCLIYMARRGLGDGSPFMTIKEIAEREHYSTPYLEKILQSLRAANIVLSHQGNQGGYALARSPAEITLREIIDALEGGTFDVFCQPQVRQEIVCTHFCQCRVTPVWDKTKALLDKFYSSITLEMLASDQSMLEGLVPAVG